MRVEHAGQRVVDGFVGAHGDDARFAQEFADRAIRGLVKIPPVEAHAYLRAELQLQLVEARDERGELGVVMRMRARDVGGVAAELGAGVDEQRVQLRRLVAPLDLVVQHGAALIQRDDRVVRQLALALAAGRHERERDLEFAGAGAERALGRDVTARAEHIRLAQAGDFIGGLRRSPVVELRDEMFRIDCARSPAKQLGKRRADERGAREILRQRRARRGAVRAAHDVEARRPVVVRHLGRLVPVVHGLVDQQQRLLARGEKHEGIRRVGERRPHLEWRLDAKWQVVIVEEQQRWSAGVHQQGVVARRFERRSTAFLHDLEVFGEQAWPRSGVLSNGVRIHGWDSMRRQTFATH